MLTTEALKAAKNDANESEVAHRMAAELLAIRVLLHDAVHR